MSMPSIPDLNAKFNIKREDTVHLLLISIALEELGLAHLLNAEAEKIQSLLGTLPHQTPKDPSLDEMVILNQEVNHTLKNIIKKEMLLQMKLESVLDIEEEEEEGEG